MYYIGANQKVENRTHMIMKFDSSHSIVYSKAFAGAILQRTPFLTSDESGIYYMLENVDRLQIVYFDTASHEVTSVLYSSNLPCDNPRACVMKPTLDASGAYIATTWQGNSNYLCKFTFSSTNLDCYSMFYSATIQTLVETDSGIFLIITGYNGYSYLEYAMVNFEQCRSGCNYKWDKQIDISYGVVGTYDYGLSYYDSDTKIVYSITEYISTIYFIAFTASNGNTYGKKYTSSGSCTEAYGLVSYGSELFVSMY